MPSLLGLGGRRERFAGLVLLSLGGCLGCADGHEATTNAALSHLTSWFESAADGKRGEEHCHAFGLIKHPDATCEDMLNHASRIVPEERSVIDVRYPKCVETVCGDFVEIELASVDESGQSVTEIAVLKRDEGRFRVYWYRTDTLLAELASSDAGSGSMTKDPDEAAYNRLTNARPGFYQFPRCMDVRVSSSNMVGGLVAYDEASVDDFEARASSCEQTFCLAFIGRKVAGVCP